MAVELLQVIEARQRLRISHSKIYDLLRTGELRSVKIGARRLIPAEAVEDYVKGLMAESSAARGGDAA